MPKPIKIDFMSDISCPWCVIGLRGLEMALERTRDLVSADIHFRPFELNPTMAKDGENVGEHGQVRNGARCSRRARRRS